MEENQEVSSQEAESALMNTYCPICGDTMHERVIRNYTYWECDDPDCGFIQPKN